MDIHLEVCSLSKEAQEINDSHKKERLEDPLIEDARRILKEAENLKSFGNLKGTLNGVTWNIVANPDKTMKISRG